MRENTPQWLALQDRLYQLKGAPLSVLAALYVLGRPAGVSELCRLTDYRHQAVENALRLLHPRAFIQKIGARGWLITDAGRQLSFFRQLAANQQVLGGSSSYIESSDSLYITTTTPQPDENQQVDRLFSTVVDNLLALGGLSPAKAAAAVQAALSRGESALDLADKIERLGAYLRTQRNLTHRGALAAQFIKGGHPVPEAAAVPADPLSRFDGYLPTEGESEP